MFVLRIIQQPAETYKNQISRESREFLHTKSKTRIACWNVRTLSSLSDHGPQLLAAIDTMKKKRIELLALSETRWSGHGIVNIRSTTILYSGPSNGVHGVAIALSPSARCSWEAAGSCYTHTHTHTHAHVHTLTCIKRGQLTPSCEGVGLLEGDLPGYVNVKEVHLAVLGHHLTKAVKSSGRVVYLVTGSLWDGPTNQIHPTVLSNSC